MQQHHAEILARGARVLAVGQGTGDEASAFCRDLGIDYPCMGDPDKKSYRAFGLPRDGWWNVTGKPFLEDTRLAWSRIRHASLKGSLMKHTDVLQLGGVVIVDRQGIVRFLHRSTRTDDLPDTRDVIAQLDRLEGGAEDD